MECFHIAKTFTPYFKINDLTEDSGKSDLGPRFRGTFSLNSLEHVFRKSSNCLSDRLVLQIPKKNSNSNLIYRTASSSIGMYRPIPFQEFCNTPIDVIQAPLFSVSSLRLSNKAIPHMLCRRNKLSQ